MPIWNEDGTSDVGAFLAQSRQTDRIGKDSLEGHSQESGCFIFSDLQPAACVLHSTKLGCSRCGRAARYASQQPRDETLLSTGVGSPGSRAPRTREPKNGAGTRLVTNS